MRREGRRNRARRLIAALIVALSLLLFVTLTLQPAPQTVQVQPTRPRSVAGESGEAQMIYLPLVANAGTSARVAEDVPDPVAIQEPGTTPKAEGPIYWGIYRPDIPYNMTKVEDFEASVGKGMSIIHWAQPWIMKGKPQRFQTGEFEKVRQRGTIPMISWDAWDFTKGTNQPDFQLADIIAGTYDDYIRQWATEAKAWGHPFFLRLHREMNGWWQFPWSERLNGNKPGEYIQSWRHIHDIFTEVGATNVTWIWAPNISSAKTTPLPEVYPGDAYVDWTAIDGYNFGTDRGNIWQTFDQVIAGSAYNTNKNTYEQLLELAPDKPIMIAETGSSEDGGPLGRPGSKAQWITDALTTLPAKFPRIRAFVWFNFDENDPVLDWPIESSPESVEAFKTGISSEYYAPNVFSNLDTSPIP